MSCLPKTKRMYGKRNQMTLLEFFGLLRKHWQFVIALTVAATLVTGVAVRIMPDQYTATTSMYVLSQGENDKNTTAYNDLSAGQMLTNDVSTLIKSDRVEQDVAQSLGLSSLSGYKVDVTSSTTTRVISLSVTGTDPQMASDIANAFVSHVSGVAQQVMGVESVNVIDNASVPTEPSGPRRALYTLVGALVGLLASVFIMVILDLVDTRIKSSEEAEQLLGVPVIGHFPNLGRS